MRLRELFESHPVFEPFEASTLARLRERTVWPDVDEYNTLVGIEAPRFAVVADEAVTGVGGYESFIRETGCVPTRPRNRHDLFNALAWSQFPRSKAALNELQVREQQSRERDPRNDRSPMQSRAAVFDEGGVVVVSEDSRLLRGLESFEFKRVFWAERERCLRHLRVLVIGHALMDALRVASPEPHSGLCGRGLLMSITPGESSSPTSSLRAAIDERVAERIVACELPQHFDPVPVLGIPEWHEPQSESFYDDRDYFRRRRRPSAATPIRQL